MVGVLTLMGSFFLIGSASGQTTMSVGNRVFRDANSNGHRDAGEEGIGGVALVLVDATTNSQVSGVSVSNANGYYRFDGVASGQYYVMVLASNFAVGGTLSGSQSSPGSSGGEDFDSGIGSQPTTLGIVSAPFSLGGANPVGETDLGPGDPTGAADSSANLTIDFGFLSSTASGGVGSAIYTYQNNVWLDSNSNGVHEAGEAPAVGAPVRLYSSAGVLVGTTSTNAAGSYQFSSLSAGNYTVEVVAISGMQFLNGGPLGATGRSDTYRFSVVVPGGGGSAAGLAPPTVKIQGTVWADYDGDGVQDSDEPIVPGAIVEVVGPAGQVVASQTTGADGKYLFDSLPAANYTVRFNYPTVPQPAAQQATPQLATDNVQGPAANPTVAAGAASGGNVGAKAAATASPTNGPLATKPAAAISAPSQAASKPSSVDLALIAKLLGAQKGDPTAQPVGVGSDLPVGSSVPAPSDDAGTLRGSVWEDADADGLRGGTEDGLAGVRVNVLDSANALIDSRLTDGLGNFSISVRPGRYRVVFGPSEGDHLTQALDGGRTDSEAHPGFGYTKYVDVGVGEIYSFIAGVVPGGGSIGGVVWADSNANGVREADEEGAANVTVIVANSAGATVDKAVTGRDGSYSFLRLADGDYQVSIETPDDEAFSPRINQSLSGGAVVSQVDPQLGSSDLIHVTNGQRLSLNAGVLTDGSAVAALPALQNDEPGDVAAVSSGGNPSRQRWAPVGIGLVLVGGGALALLPPKRPSFPA